MKILVIQQKMIGDVLTSSILFTVLRETYPDAKLHYLINSNTFPVVEHHPDIDKFVFVTPKINQSTIKFYKFLKTIKNENYDVVIDVYGKWSSNFITLFSNAKIKIGYYKWYTRFFYTHPVKRTKISKNNSGLAIKNRLQLLEPLCKNIISVKPKIYLQPAEIKVAQQFLLNSKIDVSKPLFMISVLGSDANKTYPFSYMAIIIDTIVNLTKGTILFNYIPKQKAEALAIYNLCQPETQQYIRLDVFGKSLRDFISITSQCNALIGNEGGAVNMAKAINISTFSIFSPWINKETWGVFEHDTQNTSVHLKDFNPELFKNNKTNKVKKQVSAYYQEFNPELFLDKLTSFLKHHI